MNRRTEKEKRIVGLMIRLYCRKSEGNRELCASCRELIEYANSRLDRCPYGDRKGACKHCAIHCYSPEMRQKIRVVMKFSGPRMLLYRPLEVLRHWLRR